MNREFTPNLNFRTRRQDLWIIMTIAILSLVVPVV